MRANLKLKQSNFSSNSAIHFGSICATYFGSNGATLKDQVFNPCIAKEMKLWFI